MSVFNVDCCQTSSSVPFSFECGNNALVSILGQPQEQKTKCEKTWFYFLKVLFFYAKYRKYYPIPKSPGILISTSRYEIMIKSSDSEYAIPLTQSRLLIELNFPISCNVTSRYNKFIALKSMTSHDFIRYTSWEILAFSSREFNSKVLFIKREMLIMLIDKKNAERDNKSHKNTCFLNLVTACLSI